jgi:hypothetical protein
VPLWASGLVQEQSKNLLRDHKMSKKLIKEGVKALTEQFNTAAIARGAKKFQKSPDAFFDKRMPKKATVMPGTPQFSQNAIRGMDDYAREKYGESIFGNFATPDNPREFRPDPNDFASMADKNASRNREKIDDVKRYRLNPMDTPVLKDNPFIPNPEAATDRFKSGMSISSSPFGPSNNMAPDMIHGNKLKYVQRLKRNYTDPGVGGAAQAIDSLTRNVDRNPNTKPGTALNPLDMQKAKGSIALIRKAFKSLNKMQF